MYLSLEIENCARNSELLNNQDTSDQSHLEEFPLPAWALYLQSAR